MTFSDFRIALGYRGNKSEAKEDRLIELAEYDGISLDEANNRVEEAAIVLEVVWYYTLEEGRDAYDVFNHYLNKYDGFDWYVKKSEVAFVWTLRFLEKNEFNGSIIDFGGGNGDFALAAASCGYDVTYYDTSKSSVDFVRWRAKKLSVDLEITSEMPEKKYDCLCAFEVAEHFQDIGDFVAILSTLNRCNDSAYFIEASSFSARSCGHFDTYRFEENDILASAAARKFRDNVRTRYVIAEKGYNGRPIAWRFKKDKIKNES